MENKKILQKLFDISKKIFEETEYIFFWKPQENNGFLSQWYLCNFTENDITFNCAEQYMMYHKAKLFNDEKTAQLILLEMNPKNHKSLGRQIKNFNSEIWDLNKCRIVYSGNKLKFEQNFNLKIKFLKFDKNSCFVESSPFDTIWGVGMNQYDCIEAILKSKEWDERVDWNGENLLGFILSILRSEYNNVFIYKCLQ